MIQALLFRRLRRASWLGGVFLSAVTLAASWPSPPAWGAPETIEGDPAAGQTEYNTAAAAGNAAMTALDTAPVSSILPWVRLTPRDLQLPGVDQGRLSLNGPWRFSHVVPEGFNGTQTSIAEWGTVTVPGHYHLQGFPRMHKEMGVPVAWTRTFDVPADWAGRRVVLRFEAIEGLTRLWINGRPAGSRDIASLPSEYDITQFIKFGNSNTITLTVEKSLVTSWSRRELGSITRDVWLWSLPPVNLARLHVTTDLHLEGAAAGSATVFAHVKVANQSDASVADASLAFSLIDSAGQAVPLEPSTATLTLPTIAPGQTLELTYPLHVPADANVASWTAETPDLYTLRGELRRDASVGQNDQPDDPGTLAMAAQQRFGFREIQVVGHEFRLNGQPIRMRGTNYHLTYPGRHETLPPELIRIDLDLFLDANLNTLRSRPTPDIAYVNLCDEMGMYTTVEAMISLMMYDKGPTGDYGADPTIAPGFRFHLATMVENYYSNPSVMTWGLGNECPYYDYFKIGALGLAERDPSRPIFFGSDARLGVGIPFVDINDDHYPRGKHGMAPPYGIGHADDPARIDGDGWLYPQDRPIFFTEWMHLHVNNALEIAYDPGVDDYWGHVAETHIEYMYDRPHFLGGFHFKGAPYRAIGNNDHWRAIFEANRRINDTFWHTKKAHSPVRILDPLGIRDPQSGALSVEVENRYDFLDLADLTLKWSRGEESGTLEVALPPHTTGTLTIPPTSSGRPVEDPVHLTVIDPHGREIDRYTLGAPADRPASAVDAEDDLAWSVRRETDDTVVLQRGDAEVAINKTDGRIMAARVGDRPVVTGPPELLILPAELRNFQRQRQVALVNQATNWKPESVTMQRQDDVFRVVVAGAYEHAAGTFATSFLPDGRVTVAYDFAWTGLEQINIFSAGLRIPVAEALDTLSWSRRSQWSAYPDDHIGRPVGTAPALGHPTYRALRDGYTPPTTQGVALSIEPWPWSQDLISGVTRDFRSSKFNVFVAGLADADRAAGITVMGRGVQHVQAVPAHDNLGGDLRFEAPAAEPSDPAGWHLHVLDFHNGGTEPHLTKSLRYGQIITDAETRFAGQAEFRLTPPAIQQR